MRLFSNQFYLCDGYDWQCSRYEVVSFANFLT